jgi:hypothetical protein
MFEPSRTTEFLRLSRTAIGIPRADILLKIGAQVFQIMHDTEMVVSRLFHRRCAYLHRILYHQEVIFW